MIPIPKGLLIHTATLKSPTGNDSWQDTTYSGTILKSVRIEPCSKVIYTNDNTKVQLSGTLFFDCKNSIPKDAVFEIGQKLVWSGREFTIATIEPIYGRKLHHIEVGLA